REAVLREAALALGPDAAGAALAALESAGLLRLRTASAPPASLAAEAYWDLAGLDGGLAAREVATARVRVVALPGTDPARLHTALRESGIRLAPDGDPAAFALVLCADYLDPAL
ncbi:hypothetical protein GTY23_41200, partial [Streptomyces sp. SID5998]|nr:hypothetical protein [Streptomyces sp. SID5998]